MFLGLDIGTAHTGVALCEGDPRIGEPAIATPIDTLDGKTAVKDLAPIIDEYKIQTVVIGMPYNMQGEQTQQSEFTHKIAQKIAEKYPQTTIEYVDERLTTKQAFDVMGMSSDPARRTSPREAQNKKDNKDAISAQIILQAYLDKVSESA